MGDVQAIQAHIPTVEQVSPELILPLKALRNGRQQEARCVGISNAFFDLNNLKIERGSAFHALQMKDGLPVCIIGKNIQTKRETRQTRKKHGKTTSQNYPVLDVQPGVERNMNKSKLKLNRTHDLPNSSQSTTSWIA